MDIQRVWREYQEPIKRFVAKRMDNHADAEDIVQNVFMKINDHISELKDEKKIQPWIYQIARNSIADYYRRGKKSEEFTDCFNLNEENKKEDYSKEVISCFQDVIHQLPEKYREVVELSELKGMSQKELSEYLDISYSGAKSRVQRGREMMKNLLQGCCHIESDKYGNIVDFYIK
ncbi:RNA polymerase sigma factor SigZ [Sporolactobacillus laevolacticus]|uniref:RNA polymerase sigma factor SigZ n=1 Tax=Sporolactobacillus laevolacticus TaxID=33018 RepID=UPI0025B533ED|nr:RNA polymerase sigma factor SigZ [Sporolactobacillus laevolacticus]MDN3954483.1 RNA polymerase sigma factor SigZ [Sporolactobacillus laevolacticus]